MNPVSKLYFRLNLLALFILNLIPTHPASCQNNPDGFFSKALSEVYGVLPADKKLFVYKINQSKGEVDFSIKNELLENIAYKSVLFSPGIEKIEADIYGDKAFILLGYGISKNYQIMLLVVNLETGAYSQKTVQSNFDFPAFFKAFSSSVLMVGVLEEGDVLEIYNFEDNHLSTITDFFKPDTKILNIKVVNDQVDLLLLSGRKKRKQLQLLSYDKEGNRLLNVLVKFPDHKKFYVGNAQLLHGPYQEQKIVGTYSNKYGEWFSGYFYFGINEFLEQRIQLFPFKELDGFYDYLGRNKKTGKPSRNFFNREMVLVDAVTEGETITIAAQPLGTVRKFAHFISIDQEGEKIFDKSVKLYYNYRIQASELQLTANDSIVYFLFGGNQNRLNLQGKKIYEIYKGENIQVNQVHTLLPDPSILNAIPNPKFLHWYDNKFVIFGLAMPDGRRVNQPELIIRKIEV
jgi:hypothetical protein